jgi:hypothetical protein
MKKLYAETVRKQDEDNRVKQAQTRDTTPKRQPTTQPQ